MGVRSSNQTWDSCFLLTGIAAAEDEMALCVRRSPGPLSCLHRKLAARKHKMLV